MYAPGLYPMDFTPSPRRTSRDSGGSSTPPCWRRGSLVRIATGRDAADTAFLDNHKGGINLNWMTVTAIVDGDLPSDQIDGLVSIG